MERSKDPERFTPGVDDELMHLEHLHRYRWSRRFLSGSTVLDAACGNGYGTTMLAEAARSVIGVDSDPVVVARAKRRYGAVGTRFVAGDIRGLGFPSETFDGVVSFETLEHIEEHETFIEEIGRVLKPDGLLILSTPNKRVYSADSSHENPCHRREVDHDGLSQLLASHFGHQLILGQSVLPGSLVAPLAEGTPWTIEEALFFDESRVEFEAPWLRSAKYFVALASNRPLPEIEEGLLLVESRSRLLEGMERDLRALTRGIEEKDKEMLQVATWARGLEGQSLRFREEFHQEIEAKNDQLQKIGKWALELEGGLLLTQEQCRQEIEAKNDELERVGKWALELESVAFQSQARIAHLESQLEELRQGLSNRLG